VGAAPHRWLARLVAAQLDPRAAALEVPSYVYVSAPAEFLAERPVKDLKPLPSETREQLNRLGFHKVAQVQDLAYKVLKSQFGEEALKIREVAAGRWPDPVSPNYPPGSEAVSLGFEGGLEDREALEEACRRVCDHMHEKLLARSRETSKLTLVLSGEKTPVMASKTATRPFRTRRRLQAAADEILRRLNPRESIFALRLMAEELTERVTPQLSFEPRNKPRERKLSAESAVHYLKKAYGVSGPTLARDVRLPHRERVLMEWRRAYGEP
ncbi:MAG: hypothetical protein ACOCX1_02430, partial [Fimbriimonadaceae bacterium]